MIIPSFSFISQAHFVIKVSWLKIVSSKFTKKF